MQIGVVIPAFNAARFVGAAIESALGQTVPPEQIVVVDDGSLDETGAVVRAYPEVRLIQQRNGGVAAARNRGVRETGTDWLAFLDADDLWMPEKLKLQVECAQRAGAGAVFCDLQTIDIDGREMPQQPGADVSLEIAPLLLHAASIPQGTSSTILVRRSTFESCGGYDESLATMADWDLLIRLRQVTTFAHVPQRLTAYRRYPGTMSQSVAMLERESLIVLDKIFGREDLRDDWRRLEGQSRAWNDLVLSGSHFGAGHLAAAFRFGLRAVRRNPRLIARALAMPVRKARGFGVDR